MRNMLHHVIVHIGSPSKYVTRCNRQYTAVVYTSTTVQGIEVLNR